MTIDSTSRPDRPESSEPVVPAASAERVGQRHVPGAPAPEIPAAPVDGGLFRKRVDAIGPAPLFFSVALGVFFGASIGLLVSQPIIGIIFGAMLGGLYGVMRSGSHRA